MSLQPDFDAAASNSAEVSYRAICLNFQALWGIRQSPTPCRIPLEAEAACPEWPLPVVEVQPSHEPAGIWERQATSTALKRDGCEKLCSLDLAGLWALDSPTMGLWQVVEA